MKSEKEIWICSNCGYEAEKKEFYSIGCPNCKEITRLKKKVLEEESKWEKKSK